MEGGGTGSIQQSNRDKLRLELDDALRVYHMPWTTELIKGRLYVGPFLKDRLDALYVVRVMNASHVVNMFPLTTEVTKSGEPRDTWYEKAHWENFVNPKVHPQLPEVVRLPIPDPSSNEALNKINETKQLAYYMSVAKRVASILETNLNATVYIHQKTGFDEEACVGFLAWHIYSRATCPTDVNVWCDKEKYERVLNTEKQRAFMNKALKGMNAVNHSFMEWAQKKRRK